jgi:hypothetical protein
MESIANYWYLHKSEQASIRLMHPYISDIVYEAIDLNEYTIQNRNWDEYTVAQFLRNYIRDVQEIAISYEQVEDALCDLCEQGLIDYDGESINL